MKKILRGSKRRPQIAHRSKNDQSVLTPLVFPQRAQEQTRRKACPMHIEKTGSKSTFPSATFDRLVIVAQIIGAASAYWFFGCAKKDLGVALGIAMALGFIGPAKHWLEHVFRRFVDRLPGCKSKQLPQLAATVLAAYLGVWVYHGVETYFA